MINLSLHSRLCFWLVVLGLFMSQMSYSQNTISGKVMSYDKQPLQYANVYLQNNHSFTTSDAQGGFTLKIKTDNLVYDTLVISFIGFQTEKIPVNLKNSALELKSITLNNNINNLPEFSVVAPPSVKTIMRNARRNIKNNYSRKAMNMDGFNRETMYENDKCIELNEAIIQVDYSKYPMKYGLRKSFRSFWNNMETSKSVNAYGNVFFYSQYFPYFISPQDHIYVLESRISLNQSQFGQEPSPYGGPTDLIALDNVKYQYDFLDKKNEDDYDYAFKQHQIVAGILCYEISFRPKSTSNTQVFHSYNKKSEYPIYAGRIFISADDYAVVKFEGQTAVSADFSEYNSEKSGFKYPDILEFTVDYLKDEDGQYTVNHVHLEQVINKTMNTKTHRYKL